MTNDEASRRTRFLVAYDAQLRTDAEAPDAIGVTRFGPLRLVTCAGGRDFISHHDRGDATTRVVRRLVPEAQGFYLSDQDIERVEWKTPGLLASHS